MGQLIELILRLLALLGGTITSGAEPAMIIPDRAPAPVVVEEDDAGWDCANMGDFVCGPLIELDDGFLVDANGWVFRRGADERGTPVDVDCVFAAPCHLAQQQPDHPPISRPGCRGDLECALAHGLEMGDG